MFVRNGTNVPMPDCPRVKEVSKVFRVGMPKKEVEDTPTIIAVQQRYMTIHDNLGDVHPQNISRKGFCQIFGGSTAPKYLTEGVPSNIWGVYSPQIFDGWCSVKYLGGVQPPNI